MKSSIYVAHRLGGQRLILHPFAANSEFFAEGSGLAILCREGPADHEATELRASLEASLKDGLREWLLERSFIARVALSSVSFLVIYLFFSIVVRDPVPVLDEVTLGVIAAVLVWRLHSARVLRSVTASKAAAWSTKELEDAPFESSGAIAWVEDRLAELDSPSPPDPAHWLDSPSVKLDSSNRADLDAFRRALARHLVRTTFFGPEDPTRTGERARAALGLNRPLGRRLSPFQTSGRIILYALYLKIEAELRL